MSSGISQEIRTIRSYYFILWIVVFLRIQNILLIYSTLTSVILRYYCLWTKTWNAMCFYRVFHKGNLYFHLKWAIKVGKHWLVFCRHQLTLPLLLLMTWGVLSLPALFTRGLRRILSADGSRGGWGFTNGTASLPLSAPSVHVWLVLRDSDKNQHTLISDNIFELNCPQTVWLNHLIIAKPCKTLAV